MIKKFMSFLLVGALTLSLSSNVSAASFGDVDTGDVSTDNEVSLTDLWLEGRDSFKLISASNDNKNFVSQFVIGDVTYQIEESFNEDYSVVESDFYEINDSNKQFVGQQKTIFEKTGDEVAVTVVEDEKVIDTQSFKIGQLESVDISSGNENITTMANSIEYKWFSQGKFNGSNNIYRYTVAAIVGALAAAAGSASAGGLAAVASMVISEHWPAVYWTRETWHYMQRNPSSPLWPNWTSAHKYKYYTKYYSDKGRTNYIGSSSYIDG